MKTLWRQYKNPIVVAVFLFLMTLVWAWLSHRQALEQERHSLARHAHSLAQGVSLIVAQFEGVSPERDAEFERMLRQRLRVGAPFRFIDIKRGQQVVASLQGAEPPGRRSSPEGLEGLVFERVPLYDAPPPPNRGHRRGRPPWRWHFQDRVEGVEPLHLHVGMSPGLSPSAQRRTMISIFTVLGASWLAIVALAMFWARGIRNRILGAALDAERRQRTHLEEMNLAAAGLAHELKNPLGLILGLASRLVDTPGVSRVGLDTAEQIMDEADRASARLGDFINFARLPTPEIKPCQADEVIEGVVKALRYDYEEAQVTLLTELEPVTIACDVSMLEQVLINLLLNSLQASEPGTTTWLGLRAQGSQATLVVEDQGCGISPELLPDIFKPYVTGRADGHGLGLAVVRRDVEEHGWSLSVTSLPQQGTTFTIGQIEVLSREAGL